jgi:acetyltransferase-like isoleucine patch superfamily enzyme
MTSLKWRVFSYFLTGGFAECGPGSIIVPPVFIYGEKKIKIGNYVYVGPRSWIRAPGKEPDNRTIIINIGSGTTISGSLTLSAVKSVIIEENVLMGFNVCIVDHIHKYTDMQVPIKSQGIDKVASVKICKGSWIGQNVVICPGVTIGEGSVVGANSVVTHDVPDRCVAVGAPCRVIKQMTYTDSK